MKVVPFLTTSLAVAVTLTACSGSVQLNELNQSQLTDALLSTDALPIGYVVRQADETDTSVTSYCDFLKNPDLPATTVVAARTFSKGTGTGAVVVRSTLRQYSSNANAQKVFDALVETMKTCTTGKYSDQAANFAVAPTDQVGEQSTTVKTSAKAATIYSGYSVNGPVIATVSNADKSTNGDAALNSSLLQKQVDKYVAIASEQR